MNYENLSVEIPSLRKLHDWFGFWPSFHDSEVVKVELDRVGQSRLVVHAFTTKAETDSTGHYITEKHAHIHFLLEDVTNTEILGFNHQNVLSALLIAKIDDGYKLTLGGCYGAEGWIVAAQFAVEIEPGLPAESTYARSD